MDFKVLNNISYGMYVIATRYNDDNFGCFVNTVSQITADNPTIAVSVNKQNYTNEMIRKTKRFSVSILSEKTNPKVIGTFGFFSSKDTDKFADTDFEYMQDLPILTDNMCGNLICELIDIVDVETHDIFVARVLDTKSYEEQLTPMTYKYYHEVVKGKAPKTAPTYRNLENEVTTSTANNDLSGEAESTNETTTSTNNEANNLEPSQNDSETTQDSTTTEFKKYRCTVCGHIYDEAVEGVRFCDLPDDWVCPICGVGKELFVEE